MKKIVLLLIMAIISGCSNDDSPSAVPVVTLNGVPSFTSASFTWSGTIGKYEYVLNQSAAQPSVDGALLESESFTATSLAPATTYYFHVRSIYPTFKSRWGSIAFTTETNDDCSGAKTLTIGETFDDEVVVGSLEGASDSDLEGPGCAGYEGRDVWYKVVVPESGYVVIETGPYDDEELSILDSGLAVYGGANCSSLVLDSCNDDGGIGVFSRLEVTGEAGDILYIRVWEYANSSGNSAFKISAHR